MTKQRVMIHLRLLSLLCLPLLPSPARSDETVKSTEPIITTEGEAGVVVTGGNANAQSYNFKDASTYAFDSNLFKLYGHYLATTTKGVDSAQNWDLGLRYERVLSEKLSAYVGQNVEGDTFAGYTQRYNSDAGLKYALMKEKDLTWNAEGGYRLSVQNALDGTSSTLHFIRLYTEVSKDWTKTFNTKYSLEFLPCLTDSNSYRINSDLSAAAAISSVFSIKLSYGVKYNNAPPPGAAYKTDSTFTTALVAKLNTEKEKDKTL